MSAVIGPGVGGPAAAGRAAAQFVSRAIAELGRGASTQMRAISGGLRERGAVHSDTDRRIAMAVDRHGQVFHEHVGEVGDPYSCWMRELKGQGVDTDRMMSDMTTIWDFLRRDPKWELDRDHSYGGVVLFGSEDTGGSAVVVNLMRDLESSDIPLVCSGSYGEAAKFRVAVEKLGLDSNRIIEEPLATNTEQNAVNSTELLKQRGHDVESIIAVCTPQHVRRVESTIRKHCPDVRHIAMVAKDIPVDTYIRYGYRMVPEEARVPEDVVSAILGEIKRLDEYPLEGHILEQEIPSDVREAYGRLTQTFQPTEKRY
ncbi:YdcF family protein [Nocardia sp. KC 131]|uniref:YdcF family protein n=1 Tax=Nocardia arseniciresistens TaxID=3392119 RepID=UPI00398F439A